VKILVISMAGIGDTLLSTPLIHELRLNFPDATIDTLAMHAASKDILENNPYINHVFQKNMIKHGRLAGLKFLWSLRANQYDISINTHPQSRNHYRIAAWIVGAKTRISHRYECFNLLDRWLVNQTLPQDYQRHSVDNNFDILPLIGAKKKLPLHELDLFLTPDEEKWAEQFLRDNGLKGKKVLGVHVGSGSTKNLSMKRWPLHLFTGLVKKLNRERPDIHVLLFGGPDEIRDHQLLLGEADRKLTREAKTQNMRQTAALIKHCGAFLSVDTALMHLAAALKVSNQIVIEAPTLNVTNWPYGNSFTLVKNPVVNGRGLDYYRYDGGDIKGTREELIACMESVTIPDVYAAIVKLI
jgi:ADP-heptose:LPS heptosyltransferase